MVKPTRWRAETAIIVIVKVEIIEGTLQPLSKLCIDPPRLLSVLLLLLPLLLTHLRVIIIVIVNIVIIVTKTILINLHTALSCKDCPPLKRLSPGLSILIFN